MQNSDPCPNLKECLHEDDVKIALESLEAGKASEK